MLSFCGEKLSGTNILVAGMTKYLYSLVGLQPWCCCPDELSCPGGAGAGVLECRVQDVMKLKLWFNQEKLNYQRSPEIIILIVQFT